MITRSVPLALALATLVACSDTRPQGQARGTAPPPSAAAAALVGQAGNPPSAAVFVGCGYLLLENHGRTHFTVLLRAEHAVQFPLEGRSVFDLDEVLVETTVADAATMGAPEARGPELLARHMEWEAEFTAREQGWTAFRPAGGPVDLGTGFPAGFWGYDTPAPLDVFGVKVTRMAYLTTAIDDRVFVMAAPMRPGDDPRVIARTLRAGMGSLRRAREPIDPHTFSEKIRSEPEPWEGCGSGAGTATPSHDAG